MVNFGNAAMDRNVYNTAMGPSAAASSMTVPSGGTNWMDILSQILPMVTNSIGGKKETQPSGEQGYRVGTFQSPKQMPPRDYGAMIRQLMMSGIGG